MENNSKPYHLMTPAERTAARIAKNRVIDAQAAVANEKRQAVTTVRTMRKARSLTLQLHRSLLEETGEGLPAEMLSNMLDLSKLIDRK